ncbi:MAG: protein-glutamate O-methyltransferase CheR [Deltaproteobacteria bacterium]|nr:protein-glutamate O-methyltransferase CheR [Deltaproteobacteria bacterium]
MELSQADFQNIREYIYKICGLDIKEDKKYLIRQRLGTLVLDAGCKSFAEFNERLVRENSAPMKDKVIGAITTNETSFFRDKHPFDTFKNYILPILGELIKVRKSRSMDIKGPKVRIWCAAASTGQEPYSLAILIHEYVQLCRLFGISTSDFGIQATDISPEVLAKAIAGEYNAVEVSRGLTPDQRAKYFVKAGNSLVIQSWIRSMVDFRRANLIEPFMLFGNFDVILCRNVLIYFDDETKKKILDKFFNSLNENGLLMLGASENMFTLTSKFQPIRVGDTNLYQKKCSPPSNLPPVQPKFKS